jgi:hypothetical protein
MTILYGEHYVVETLSQFCERLGFDWEDIATAMRQDERYDFPDIVREANELHGGEEWWEPVDSISEMSETDIAEFIGGHNISTNDAIIATLEQDDREWIHLFDGHVHDVVEIHE